MIGLVGGVAFELQHKLVDRFECFFSASELERKKIFADRDSQPEAQILDATAGGMSKRISPAEARRSHNRAIAGVKAEHFGKFVELGANASRHAVAWIGQDVDWAQLVTILTMRFVRQQDEQRLQDLLLLERAASAKLPRTAARRASVGLRLVVLKLAPTSNQDAGGHPTWLFLASIYIASAL